MQHNRAIQESAQVIQFRSRQSHGPGFTSLDLLSLRLWDKGERRLEVDSPEGASGGQFAMIFEGDQPWASWAIGRENGKLLVWDCVSLADLGRFDTMRQALAALPGASDLAGAVIAAQVISFRDALARRLAG